MTAYTAVTSTSASSSPTFALRIANARIPLGLISANALKVCMQLFLESDDFDYYYGPRNVQFFLVPSKSFVKAIGASPRGKIQTRVKILTSVRRAPTTARPVCASITKAGTPVTATAAGNSARTAPLASVGTIMYTSPFEKYRTLGDGKILVTLSL